MNSIDFLVYTNQSYIPIVNLFSKNFFEKTNNRYNLTLVTNHHNNDILLNDKLSVINTQTQFSSTGHHFSQTLSTALLTLTSEYIFFFCDDYYLTRDVDHEKLMQLTEFMHKENIQHFSFSSCHPESKKWPVYKTSCFEGIDLYEVSNSFRYMTSVQPCIWKRETLVKVLQYNPHMSLHEFDNSMLRDGNSYRQIIGNTEMCTPWQNTDLYNFTKLCSNFKAYDELSDDNTNTYFVIQYVEAVRHGLFNIYLNVRGAAYIKQFLLENNIQKSNSTYGRFFA